MSHLTDESLRRFTAGTASPAEGREILAHLLARCRVCAERLRTMAGLEAPPAPCYERPLDRFEDHLRHALGRPLALRASPEELLGELDRLPALQQELLARNSARYRVQALCELLVHRSFTLRHQDPQRCVHYGRLAVLVARRLEPGDPVDALRLNDLRIRSFALFANALRVRGDLDEADAAMTAAHQLLAAGGASPSVEAMVYELSGSLRSYQRRFREAIELYLRAIDLHRRVSEPAILARALVGQALATSYSGQAEAARALLGEAIPKIGPGNSRLTLAACHALIDSEIELGRTEVAALHWVEIRPLYEKVGDCLMRIRQGWLEGKLLIAQGDLRAGLRLMEEAHAQYVAKGLRYDAAVISLEMAPGYLRLGRHAEARRLMMQAVPVFQSLGIRRELLGAMILLEQSRRHDIRRSL
jgi:tetratricopeptide (TPR) repeat protein